MIMNGVLVLRIYQHEGRHPLKIRSAILKTYPAQATILRGRFKMESLWLETEHFGA